MSSNSRSSDSPSLLVRFLDAFLQERNIKWVLAVGMLILLASSLLLVTTHWETYTPLWKYLVLLGYTAAIHAGGKWTYHRLGLRRTGAVLQGLIVLLIPILFMAIRWVPQESPADALTHLGLLALTLAVSATAAWQIFGHVLRQPQPTFVLSYLTLATAGALLPALPPTWTPYAALALWAVFAAGAVKVNRHVFWLTEERRAPRVLGFIPIALLGAQFLYLYVAHAAPQASLPWLGFGCVLVAIPVLLTADAVAHVFQQRTGDLVRPLPWAIVLPLLAGLVLTAAGVALSGMSIVPPERPYALVLSAALAAALLAVVAHRTGKQAFVWAMVVCVTLAYNFSPVFFLEAARDVVDQASHAIREQRLPYGFYGLSYLPLLLGLMLVSWFLGRSQVARRRLFARPLQHYSFALACVLLGMSALHMKALLPVGLVSIAVFALHARLFRTWYAVPAAVAAALVAAYGVTPFATGVLGL